MEPLGLPSCLYAQAASAAQALAQAHHLELPLPPPATPQAGGGEMQQRGEAGVGEVERRGPGEVVDGAGEQGLQAAPLSTPPGPPRAAPAQQQQQQQQGQVQRQELTSGLVAEVLGRVAEARLQLRPVRVRVALSEEEGPGDVAATGLCVHVGLQVEAARPAHAALGECADGSEGSAAAGGGCSGDGRGPPPAEVAPVPPPPGFRYTCQATVLFQPSLVACNSEVRQQAEAACATACNAALGFGGAAAAVAALAAIRSEGSEGLAAPAVAAALQPGVVAPQSLLALLERHGLVRRATAFSEQRWVAAEASQSWLAYPLLPPAPAAAASAAGEAAGAAGGAAAASETSRLACLAAALADLPLPPQGTPQACMDVPARPWVDFRGLLNRGMWAALVRRALSVATRHPGIPRDLLVLELGAVCPAHARELLDVLEEGGLLHGRAAASVSAHAPGSVLAACFATGNVTGPHGAVAGSSSGQQQQRFYFAPLAPSAVRDDVLPPQVLVPVEGEAAGEGESTLHA